RRGAHKVYCDYRRAAVMRDILRYALKQAEASGAGDAEVYAAASNEAEVFIENNDVKQAKSQQLDSIGIRVIVDGSIGFFSVNRLTKEAVSNAARMAVKIARASPKDPYNSLPGRPKKIGLLRGIYDKASESFEASDAASVAAEMLNTARSFDKRVSVDSGSFAASSGAHYLANTNGIEVGEKLSAFSWTIMGMAIENGDVSSFDFQPGATHFVRDIDVQKTALEFARTVVGSLGPRKIDSFKGEMLLTPSAANELVEEVISHSVNSDAVQKKSSHFAGKIGKEVSTELLTLEDDPTNVEGLGASSFDREGVPHKRNVVIEEGILKKFLYNTYTARKDDTRTTGNASGSTSSPPSVSTTNFVIRPGSSSIDNLVSEMKKGIIISRFSGNVNPINGDFSGVVKGGKLVENGSIMHAVKELMVAGNVFDALKRLNGLSRERKVIFDSILPHMRIDNISFTGA
ncbi:MAG: TldD/PmbA family protein, partial [Nitrososphaera sp.]|nr:TldD/PmbA family protein [Nitrososphaera sp.]